MSAAAQQTYFDVPKGIKGRMPVVGFGTWKTPDGITQQLVYDAIKIGYRHIDAAAVYGNEQDVGAGISRALSEGICKRDELWVTSKLWNTYHKKEHVRPACQRILSDLGLDYLDLLLIHFPVSLKYVPFEESYPADWATDKGGEIVPVPLSETWAALESLVDDGLVKNIGVSNFSCQLVQDLVSYCRIRPIVNQVELHPYLQQANMIQLCKSLDILVTAYSPFGSKSYVPLGKVENEPEPLQDPVIGSIAEAHKITPAQVILKWVTQLGDNVGVLCKSSFSERIKLNFDIFSFQLSHAEMRKMAELNKNKRFNDPKFYLANDFPTPPILFDA